jgi:hypothetical protein
MSIEDHERDAEHDMMKHAFREGLEEGLKGLCKDPPLEGIAARIPTIRTSEDVGELMDTVAQMEGELTNPAKDKKGMVGNRVYWYADLPAHMDIIRPLFLKYGLALWQCPLSSPDDVNVRWMETRIYKGNQWIGWTYASPVVDQKNPIKSAGSSDTYNSRYGQRGFGMVGETDDDADRAEEKADGKAKSTPAEPTDEAPPMEPLKCSVCGEANCPVLAWGKRVHGYGVEYYDKKDPGGTMHIDGLGSTLETVTDGGIKEWTRASIHELEVDEKLKAEKSVMAELRALGVRIVEEGNDPF